MFKFMQRKTIWKQSAFKISAVHVSCAPKIKACVMQTLRREQRGTGGAAEKAKRKKYVRYLMLFWHLCNSFLSVCSLFQVRFRHHGAIRCRTKIEQRQKQKSLEHISGHGRKPAFHPPFFPNRTHISSVPHQPPITMIPLPSAT